MTTGSFVCLPALGVVLRSSSLLCFHSLCSDECTGNGGPGVKEYSGTTGRLGLGLVGLEGKALDLGALLARDCNNQLFLGLGRQRVWAETAHLTFGAAAAAIPFSSIAGSHHCSGLPTLPLQVLLPLPLLLLPVTIAAFCCN
jgi:hypothetical protein